MQESDMTKSRSSGISVNETVTTCCYVDCAYYVRGADWGHQVWEKDTRMIGITVNGFDLSLTLIDERCFDDLCELGMTLFGGDRYGRVLTTLTRQTRLLLWQARLAGSIPR